jgi:two-component system, OmpR family, alkaline phosphatase synthesis response regulator PhoP
MSSELILLVDDEPSIVFLARLYLERDGFRTLSVGDGLTALTLVHTHNPALMILDIMLPEMDGFEVCRRLRAEGHTVPIIILTAREDDIDKILGLEIGADDYLTKPFNPRELVARVKAILRRVDRTASLPKEIIRLGDLIIDPGRHEVTCQGQPIELRNQEFEVLLVFARQPMFVLTREQLLTMAWGYDFLGESRTVDVHVAQIRRKLGDCPVRIETIAGIGYKLVV